MVHTEAQVGANLRCSIVLPAGNDPLRLSAYLDKLGEMRLPGDYEVVVVNDHSLKIDERRLKDVLPTFKVLNAETVLTQEQLFDKGAVTSSGKYLLLVREFIKFDKLVLEESINELESSAEKFSISANKNFILLENNFYVPKANLGRAKEEFWKLHIGCGNRHFPAYINIDSRKTEATDYVCSAIRLPFSDASVGLIETYHLIEHLPRYDLPKALREWWRVLIPGGKLVIECPDFHKVVEKHLHRNDEKLNNIFGRQRFAGDTHLYDWSYPRLARLLENHGFAVIECRELQDYRKMEETSLRLEAFKSSRHSLQKDPEAAWRERKQKRPETLTIGWRERHIHAQLLRELRNELFERRKVVSLGCGSGELEMILGREGYDITGLDISDEALRIAEKHKKEERMDNVLFSKASIQNMPFQNDTFDAGYMIEVLEHIDPANVRKVFSEIKRVLKPGAKLFVTVPNKFAYRDLGHVQIFTKGYLAELLDRQGLSIQWIDWERRADAYRKHDMLKAMCANQPNIYDQNTRMCAIGEYRIRYDQLGFHWDGQARAFHSLGYNPLLLDIRRDTYKNLRRKIIEFKPEILWLGLKDCLPLIKWMKEDLRKIGCTIVYWFCDLRGIEGTNSNLPSKQPVIDHLQELGDILDYMFLSNTGQITAYKKSYNVHNVYYMPQACTPAYMHRVPAHEVDDVSFAGSLGKNVFFRERTKLLNNLCRSYKVCIRNEVRNYIAEFYSGSKIVLGADVIGGSSEFQPYLYTSNRLFVALGCGACYICQWFPGIEKLAENHKDLVWFKTEKELFRLIDYYLKHDEERQMIRKNAQQLAHTRHTYACRIQNMLDIVHGKADKFYGFL